MKKKIFSFIIVFSLFFVNNLSIAEEKIAFIDLNFLYSNSKIGKKINKEINDKQKKINKEFQDYQKN